MKLKYKTLIIALITILSIQILFATTIKSTVFENNPIYYSDLLGVGTQAKDWTLKDILTDTNITFSSFSGKVVLLDFFASYAENSPLSVSSLKDVRSYYSSSKLVMISIAVDYYETESDLEAFASSYGINWYMVIDTAGISNYYQVSTVPSYYIINQNQKIAFAYDNLVDFEHFVMEINPILDSYTSPTSNNSGQLSEFWQKNWYWPIVGGILVIIIIVLIFQRQRVIKHNKKVREERLERRQKRERLKRN